MIHRVWLPRETREVLGKVVNIQLSLLAYAYQCKGVYNESGCAAFIKAEPGLAGLADGVAEWVRSAKTDADESPRWKLLKAFGAHVPQAGGQQWLAGLRDDAARLGARNARGGLYRWEELPANHADRRWKEPAAEFLKLFYEEFRTGGLAGYLLGRTNYNGQEFLQAFRKRNPKQWACVACDEQIWAALDDDEIRTDIDHFFSKERYPHLCMHPHNLAPVCHQCNSSVKARLDPLQEGQTTLTLESVPLPYRGCGLQRMAYLRFDFGSAQTKNFIAVCAKVKRRRPSLVWASDRHEQQIRTHSSLFNIPGRWNARQSGEPTPLTASPSPHSACLEAMLFQRAMGYLRAADLTRPLDSEDFLSRLDELVGDVYRTETRLHPDTLALVWWLAAQAKDLSDRNHIGTGSESPFLKVVSETYSLRLQSRSEFQQLGKRLRGYLDD